MLWTSRPKEGQRNVGRETTQCRIAFSSTDPFVTPESNLGALFGNAGSDRAKKEAGLNIRMECSFFCCGHLGNYACLFTSYVHRSLPPSVRSESTCLCTTTGFFLREREKDSEKHLQTWVSSLTMSCFLSKSKLQLNVGPSCPETNLFDQCGQEG